MSFKKKNKSSTTKLPATLRDELGLPSLAGGNANTRGGRPGGGPLSFRGRGGRNPGSVIGRKDARKAERDAKRHRAPQIAPVSEKSKGKRRQVDEELRQSKVTAPRKKPRFTRHEEGEEEDESGSESESDSAAPAQKMTPLQRMLDKSESKPRPSIPKRKSNRPHLTQAEKDEEDEIAWLEAMLGGAGKRSSKGKKGAVDEDTVQETDGFDDLLDDLDRFYPGMYDGDDGEDEDEESGEDSESDSYDESTDGQEDAEDEEFSGFSGGEGSETDESAEEGSTDSSKPSKSDEQTLSAPAAAPPISTGKYIPPAARAAAAAAAEAESSSANSTATAAPSAAQQLEQQKLRRQLQGLLNRLGDSNLDSILNSLEDVYRVNRRAEVSTLLARLILDTIAMRSNLILTDTFVVVYASLVASLGRIVGMEFVAGLVSELMTDLLKFYRQAKEDEVNEVHGEGEGGVTNGSSGSSKALANLVVLLSHMYNLHVVACPLVYDLIKLFLGEVSVGNDSAQGEMSELDVESLLKVVKTCGTQLRSDDASSLKQIASIATTKTSTTSTVKSSSRTRFMLETLSNLNKTSGGGSGSSGDNTSASQMLGQMKKYLGTMEKKRSTRRWEPLRIGLKDLQDAERRGKWWLVGAVWKDEEQAGMAEDEQSTMASKKRHRNEPDGESNAEQDNQMAQLNLLARQHGMNTPARRQIFTTIMSSPDYVTAASDLLGLSLTAVQQREIIRVLLHCTARESNYNPYYSLIGMQLAQGEMKKGISITMQFCLWDYFRSIGEKSVGGQSVARDEDEDENARFDEEEEDTDVESQDRKMWNLSRCYAFWISRSTVDLTILRPIPFASLRSNRSKRFLQLFFLHLLLSSQTTSPTLSPKSGDWSKESKKRNNLEKVFISATTNNLELLMGLHLFFTTEMGTGNVAKLVSGGKKSKNVSHAQVALQDRVAWCVGVVKEILEVGLQSARRGWAGM